MSTSSITSTMSSGSGLDVGAVVDQLLYTERAPERLMQAQQSALTAQAAALRDMNSKLDALEAASNNLKDLTGAFGARSVQSSDATVLTASADSSAALGTHTITVSQPATVSSQYSDTLASPTASFTPGSLQFQLGGGALQTITFDASHSTLTTAAQYINGLNLGISASVITDAVGSRLALVSKTSGAAGDITVNSAPAGLGFHVGVIGQNAKLTVDGVPIQSATNTVSGALTGITLNLTGTTSGAPVTIAITQDSARVTQAVTSLVSAYNSVIGNINAQFAFNATTHSAGTLSGNSSLRFIQSSLLSTMSFKLSGTNSYTTLRSVGIEMKDDGTLQVNDATLAAALKDKPLEVRTFFQGSSADGFANKLGTQLATLTDSIDGPLVVDARGIDSSIRTLTDQIDDFEVRIALRKETLTALYTRIDTMLRQLPLLQSQISSQLGALQ